MRVVADQLNMIVGKVIQVLDRWIQDQAGQGSGFPTQLKLGLLQVVEVEVGIAHGMDKFPHTQTADLGHHVGEQSIRGDVKGHPQKNIGTALVQLAR